VFLLFFIGGFFTQSHIWLLNFLLAFVSAVAIMTGTYYGYKRSIQNSVETAPLEDDDEERVAGDKYGILFDDDREVETIEDVKALKKEMKKFSFSNLLLGSKIFFSFYRLFGYLFLVGVVLYLIRHEIFIISGFILGVFATTVALIISMYVVRRELSR